MSEHMSFLDYRLFPIDFKQLSGWENFKKIDFFLKPNKLGTLFLLIIAHRDQSIYE